MLIHLYEEVINQDGTKTHGRLACEVKCKGDGTAGEIIYYDICNEFRQVADEKHLNYGIKRHILSKGDKKLLEKLFNEPLFITSSAGLDTDGVHYLGGKTLMPWQDETVRFIVEYKIPAWFGTIVGKIVQL
jgi:hypothetical protein